MKKHYLFAVALSATVLVGCSQDEQLNIVDENRSGFTGVMEMTGSRTTLGDDYKVNWVVNEDQVSIFEMDDQNTQYVVESVTNGVANFEFVGYTEKTNPVSLDAYYSVYPYSEDNSISGEGVISATIPAVVDNYSDKDDAINQALMIAKSTTTDLKYTNAQGILLLRLNAQKPTNYGGIKSIKITSTNNNLAGTATMSWANGVEKPEAKIENGTKELTINLASSLQSENLPMSTTGNYAEYYIPIVPATFEKGDATMTIEWADESKTDYVQSIGIEFTVGRNEIKPLKHTIGKKDFTGTTEGAESPVSTVDELLAALQKGSNVTLQSNITLNADVEIPANATSKIDLNGYTLNTGGNAITVKGNLTVAGGEINAQAGDEDLDFAFEVANGGILNIESDAKITVQDNGTGAVYMGGGELNVDGTIAVSSANNCGVFMYGTEADINVNGTISAAENAYAINQMSGTTNVNVGVNGNLGNSMLQAASTMNLSYACSTMPVVKNDGTAVTLNVTAVVSDATALANAAKAGATNIQLTAGEYDMPGFSTLNGVKFIGESKEGTIIKLYNTQSGGDFCLAGSTATLENMTIVTEIKNWAGFQNASNLTFNKCNFINNLFLSGNATFNECHFTVTTNHYNVWAYSANSKSYTAEFNTCVFDCTGKSIYIDGNAGGTTTMKFTSCTFNDDDSGATDKAAIETGTTYGSGATYNVTITSCTFEGFAVGKNTESTIWANKNSMSADKLNITIDGVEVY